VGQAGDINFRRPWRGGFAMDNDSTGVNLPSALRRAGYPDHVGQYDGFRVVAWKRLSP
jgi:hypothetical protein